MEQTIADQLRVTAVAIKTFCESGGKQTLRLDQIPILLLQAAEELETVHNREEAYQRAYTQLQSVVKDIQRLQLFITK